MRRQGGGKDEEHSSFLSGRVNQVVQGQEAVSLPQGVEAGELDSHLACFELQ
jgi:hypothetical protein